MIENVEKVREDYFKWLYWFACKYRANKYVSYDKLLRLMHDIKFDFYMERDSSRAMDGIGLRRRFVNEKRLPLQALDAIDGPCSVLEMILALAIRIEYIMDNPRLGDRTQQWFWIMMSSLGLSMVTDDVFDEDGVTKIISDFMNRNYQRNGRGGLFYIRNTTLDMTREEIWSQMCAYLNTIE